MGGGGNKREEERRRGGWEIRCSLIADWVADDDDDLVEETCINLLFG